jgi:mannan endo-1,4-beta-mannosidase
VFAFGQSRHSDIAHGSPAGWASGATAAAADPAAPYLGVFEPGATASYAGVRRFAAATGLPVRMSLYYSAWNDPFQINLATWAAGSGALPFVQMMPVKTSLATIAAGGYDGYLRAYAGAVRAYRAPVVIGFAPEMNGGWYGWGAGHTSPAVYVAAWRHVVDVLRRAGASNAIFLWTVNSVNATHAPLEQWWPGASYVTWIGIDGYYYRPTDTFGSVFGSTLADLRAFTDKRVLISETGVGPNPNAAAQVDGLFRGVRADRLLGVVWFDQAQNDGLYHQNWRLEDDPAALAAFRTAAAITRPCPAPGGRGSPQGCAGGHR